MFVVLLTGFEKTACYVCLPSAFDFYFNRSMNGNCFLFNGVQISSVSEACITPAAMQIVAISGVNRLYIPMTHSDVT